MGVLLHDVDYDSHKHDCLHDKVESGSIHPSLQAIAGIAVYAIPQNKCNSSESAFLLENSVGQ